METSVIEHPALPESANILATAGYVISPQNLGVAATERNKLRERELTRLELRGEIKPATVLNRSPFPLECVNSPWDYIVPARQSGKPYGIKIVASTRTVFRFTGNREMSDHSVRGHHEPKIILPIEQAMEFSFFYNGLSSEDFYSKPGGVIVFEGTMEGITPKSTVRVPRYIFKKGERYLKFEDMLLGDLVKQTDEQMRNRCMAVLEQADVWADDPKTRANIQNNERVWADFAFEQKWIPAARGSFIALARIDRAARRAPEGRAIVGIEAEELIIVRSDVGGHVGRSVALPIRMRGDQLFKHAALDLHERGADGKHFHGAHRILRRKAHLLVDLAMQAPDFRVAVRLVDLHAADAGDDFLFGCQQPQQHIRFDTAAE